MSNLRVFLRASVELLLLANLLFVFMNLGALAVYSPLLDGSLNNLLIRTVVHAFATFLMAGFMAKYPLPIGEWMRGRIDYAHARATRDRRSPELIMD